MAAMDPLPSPAPARPRPGPPSLTILLREGTADAHRHIERARGFAEVMDGTLTLDGYRDLLIRLHGLYVPMERAIEELVAAHGPRHGYGYDRKVGALVADLAALGLAAPPAREAVLPGGGSALAAAVLYVVEGATLGGRVISSRVHALLGEPGQRATRLFDPYGAACGPRWLATRRFLDALAARDRLDAGAVIDHARAVFAWFERELDDAR